MNVMFYSILLGSSLISINGNDFYQMVTTLWKAEFLYKFYYKLYSQYTNLKYSIFSYLRYKIWPKWDTFFCFVLFFILLSSSDCSSIILNPLILFDPRLTISLQSSFHSLQPPPPLPTLSYPFTLGFIIIPEYDAWVVVWVHKDVPAI